MARFYLNAKPDVDLRSLMDDVKARVDAITTFPSETERPRVFYPESSHYDEVLQRRDQRKTQSSRTRNGGSAFRKTY